MTADNDAALNPDYGQTERHRLVPREKMYEDCRAKYGTVHVADYLLAVRDEVERHPEIGGVDTWSKFAELLKRRQPKVGRDRKQMRKKFSRHFTLEGKGPPWQTTVLVVLHVVPSDRQTQARALFADLFEAARGERPPDEDVRPAGPSPRPVDGIADELDEGSAPAQTAATVSDLQVRNAQLQEVAAAARKQAEAAREEVARLRDRLLLNQVPSQRGVGAGGAVGRRRPWRTPSRRHTGLTPAGHEFSGPYEALEDLRQRPLSAESEAALEALEQRSRSTVGIAVAARPELDALEQFWLDEGWRELRNPARARPRPTSGVSTGPVAQQATDGPENAAVAGQFGEIVDQLRTQGLGAHAPWTDHVPRQWTSRGPRWFYALLTVVVSVLLGVSASVGIVVITNRDREERGTDNRSIAQDNILATGLKMALRHSPADRPMPRTLVRLAVKTRVPVDVIRAERRGRLAAWPPYRS